MARLAQSAECKALNLVVVGSSPTVGVCFLDARASEKGREGGISGWHAEHGSSRRASGGGASDILYHGFQNVKIFCARWNSVVALSLQVALTDSKLDTLGFKPRVLRMRSGCDSITPCAP